MRFDGNPVSVMKRALVVMVLATAMSVSVNVYAQRATDVRADPYMRYTRPGQCVELARRLDAAYWRDKRADTVRYAPATERAPDAVIRTVRACAARFSVSDVPVRDLFGLFRLYLRTEQLDRAREAERRLVDADLKAPVVERGWELYQISLGYLYAQPTEMSDADRVLTQLDALGAPAAAWQLKAHTDFANYALSVNAIAGAVRQSRAALAASSKMARDDRVDRALDILDAYDVLSESVSFLSGGRAALAILDTASIDVLPLRGTSGTADGRSDGVSDMAELRARIQDMRLPYTIVGTVPVPIQAEHWYGVGYDSTRRDTITPRVTLVVPINPHCEALCYSTYATIRRLDETYRARGVRVVLLAQTAGYFRNHLIDHPADEAKQFRHYIFDFLKLPGTLAVHETRFAYRADGRRVDSAWVSWLAYTGGQKSAILDGDGHVRAVIAVSPARESVLNAQIHGLLR